MNTTVKRELVQIPFAYGSSAEGPLQRALRCPTQAHEAPRVLTEEAGRSVGAGAGRVIVADSHPGVLGPFPRYQNACHLSVRLERVWPRLQDG